MAICYTHESVLLAECLTGLSVKADGIYVDGTLGRGGHSSAILSGLGPTGRLLGFDQDSAVLANQDQGNLKDLFSDSRFEFVHSNFVELTSVLKERNLMGSLSGILLDLGVSSPQLDDPERGFSFQHDGPLDMRMDTTCGDDAATWLATVEGPELTRVLRLYGEEPAAKRIARAILTKMQSENPIRTTRELSETVCQVVGRKPSGKHPATRTFQAIRIAMNDELRVLERVLPQCVEALAPGGRLCVISFHSLEDRLVKQFITRESSGCVDWLPGMREPEYNQPARLRKVGKAIKATDGEKQINPRARSACLRVAEKIG